MKRGVLRINLLLSLILKALYAFGTAALSAVWKPSHAKNVNQLERFKFQPCHTIQFYLDLIFLTQLLSFFIINIIVLVMNSEKFYIKKEEKEKKENRKRKEWPVNCFWLHKHLSITDENKYSLFGSEQSPFQSSILNFLTLSHHTIKHYIQWN